MEERRRLERRQQSLAIRLPDRRRGFPRRTVSGSMRSRYVSSLIFVRDNPTVFVLLAALLLALGLADLVLTHRALSAGAIEANPVMAALFDTDFSLANAAKLGVSSLVIAGLWMLRRYRPAIASLIWMCLGMAVLVVYQTLLVLAIT